MKIDYKLYPGRSLDKKEYEEKNIKPVISIITAFYNDEKYIESTAISILNQTFPYFEWIIVNDGSTSKEAVSMLDKIKNMDSRVIVLNKENEGTAAARDFGVENADSSTEYIMFLDSDDLINKTYLECAYWTLKTNPEASFAYTDVLNFGGREFTWSKYYCSDWEKIDNILVVTALIKKQDFLKVNGFNIKEKDVFEDWYLWLKMMKEGMFPVRMSFFGFWYRQKQGKESQLQRAKNDNRKKAMRSIKEIASQIVDAKEAIQYPKQDYNWNFIEEEAKQIILPKEKKNNKKKILLIIPWMVVGGADKFNLDIVSKVNKDKYEFIIVTTESNENPWRQQFEENATVYDLTTFLDRRY